MFRPLDGPALYGALSVTSTPIEVKVGATAYGPRTVVTVQPIDGEVYYGYDNSVTTSTGTKIFKGQLMPFEAGDQLQVWLVAAGTVDVRITEVG